MTDSVPVDLPRVAGPRPQSAQSGKQILLPSAVRGQVIGTWLRGERVVSRGDGIAAITGELVRRG